MADFVPLDPDYETRVRASFGRQRVMALLGADLAAVAPGAVEITLPARDDLTQQHGYIHAGIVTAIVDSACGYAAFSLMPAGVDVLTVEYKVNFMAPATGARLLARGRVIKPGRTLTVCAGDVFVERQGEQRIVATMLATMMQAPG
jgi:uncharacterized protein (TIGR00369 family)